MGGATKPTTVRNNTATDVVASTSIKDATAKPVQRNGTKPIKLDRLGSYFPGVWVNHQENGGGGRQDAARRTEVIPTSCL